MKKIFFTFFVLSSFWFQYQNTFADVEPRECLTEKYCSIENTTRIELDIYIESNTQAVENLTALVRERGTRWEPTDGLENFRKYIVGSLNNSVDWRRFDDLFDFYVLSAMNGSMPSAIYRDYEKLANEWERISKLINMLADWLYDDMTITNNELCTNIDTWCSLDGKPIEWRLSEVLWKLYENNLAIRNYYYLNSLGREDEWISTNKVKNYFFIPLTGINWETGASVTTNFQNILSTYYWANAIAQCNQCQWGSFKKIKDYISNISQSLSIQEDSYQAWKDWWYLLIGATETSRKIEIERELLTKELSRQWVKTNNAEVILQNLDNYNNPENENGRVWGFTWGNNYISNTFKTLVTKTKKDLDTFSSTIQSEFNDISQESEGSIDAQSTTTDRFLTTQNKINTSIDIASDITSLYNLQLEHAQKDDIITNKLVTNIVDTHNNLVETIEVISKTIPISEEVCNSQAFWLWTCSFWTHK